MAPALQARGVLVQVVAFEFTPQRDSVTAVRLRSSGIPTWQIPLAGGWLRKSCAILGAFRRIGGCDILHCNSDVLSGLFLPFAKQFGATVRIVHARTPNWQCRATGRRQLWLHSSFRFLIRRYCTHALGVTQAALAAVPGGGRARMVVPSAIQSADFRSAMGRRKARRVTASCGLRLGFVGRIVSSKNVEFLIAVLRAAMERCRDVGLVYVGKGPEERRLRSLVAKAGLQQSVSFAAPTGNVAALFADVIDVLLLPSDFEGTPRIVLEAQAAGVPVICSMAVGPEVAVVPELVMRLALDRGAAAWAQAALDLSTVVVTEERVHGCFQRSAFEIEAQADLLLGLYRGFLAETEAA